MAETVAAAIVDLSKTEREGLVELAVVLFDYDRQNFEVRQVVDSYVGRTQWSGEIPPGYKRPSGLSIANSIGSPFDAQRVAAMLEKPEVLIAHSAEFAQSLVCRLGAITTAKRWKCSQRDIDWKHLGMQSAELDWLLRHHQVETWSSDHTQNGAFALLYLLRLPASDGRPYLAHLLQD